ncbi:peptide/nickel transport system ATP-binding protein/oligopeptide transport system ATP-binding protein [Actinocorallia herbida]|uniref:Peptide/nickel transport system ATP-binding protein/oligopeptide transport system ATP-binding protein n=1 Tax=Actinocorallia herbida TaxID=58109 RepID=A0A3N1CYF3_9ACTN|nr:ABC transporter ATP-binding protein [Actinocorallia herbida]ROO86312.1 peptide/nickel transport system ATP-binding protein/oligopeptide transport system ATP-binding protein [Actinocorallia herbida]
MLEVSDLRVTAGKTVLVDGISFSVGHGAMLGLVGESGSGKTTAVLALAGLLPDGVERASGEISLDGTPLTDARLAKVRGKDVGLVFQDPSSSLDPLMRVGSQVAEVFRIHGASRGEARRRAVALLSRVGIERPRAHPHQLSGGQRQRVGIAVAIALGPRLLIADEPTTALDVTVQAQIMELLLSAQKETGAATVLVSHDLDLVARHADTVAVMYAGRLVETGPAAKISARPGHPYTKALLESRPKLGAGRGPLPVIPGQAPHPSDRPSGCAFYPRCPIALARCASETPALKNGVACWAAADE